MPGKILFILLLCSLIFALPVNSQNPFPSLPPAASKGEVLGIFDKIFDWLNNILGEKKLPEEITAVVERSNPIIPDSSSADSTGSNVEVSALGYSKALAGASPKETPTDKQTFFDKIMGIFGWGLSDSLVAQGNEDALGFAASNQPQNVARDVIAGSQINSPLAQGNANVLGTDPSEQVMPLALDIARCSRLPLALCPVNDYGGTNPDIPPPPPDTNPPPGGDLPAVCYERPTCNNGVGDCYKDTSIGQCWIYTKGYCSVECLKPFFGDETMAKIASQICNRESGGNPFVVNEGCLKPDTSKRSKEYSVGLFQINLWPDEYRPYRCPGTLQRQATPPPYYYCEKGPNFDRCRTEFTDAKRNIEAAYQLYRARGNKWGDWAAAGPDYCDIK